MKSFFKFGLLKPKTIVKGIFFITLLQILMYVYFVNVTLSLNSNWIQTVAFKIHFIYFRYLQPIVAIVWLTFVCEFLYRVMARTDEE